jgi:O-antigen ligase
VAAVALELLRRGEPLRLPALLTLPLALLALAVAGGALVGYARGAPVVDIVYSGRQLVYLIVLPVLVYNVVRTRRRLLAALALGAALAILKAALGLLAVAAGGGITVEGATITYYEPVANWLMMAALLGVLAAVLLRARDRLPLWVLLGSPLMIVSLALSFRRSFWIGLALGLVLVLVLGASSQGRRLLIPTTALVAVAIWALTAVGYQVQGPVAQRAESLRPSAIATNAEDRYRFDERANVLAELAAQPVAGLGLAIEWSSAARPLGVEHENGRQYVHMIVLWYWLKLGLLGLLAYCSLMLAAAMMAWRLWRRDPDPLMRAAGLATLCGLVALGVVETTGSFTGVETRFSIVFGAMLGLLAAAYRGASSRSTRSPTA